MINVKLINSDDYDNIISTLKEAKNYRIGELGIVKDENEKENIRLFCAIQSMVNTVEMIDYILTELTKTP